MLRKWGALIAANITVLLLLAMPFTALGQNTGKITGTVIDADSGTPLPGANVLLMGTQLGTATNVDGEYTIIGVPVGSYDVRASFVGYQTVTQASVEITAGYTIELDFELQAGQILETIVVEYERPIIQRDAIGVPKVATAEEIANLPVRGAAGIAGLQAGVVTEATSNNLYIRGGREQDVAYYVNGVKVISGTPSVPAMAIQQVEMLIGSIPARYGDVMSGVVSITTKSGAPDFFGTIEGVTSEVLDPYGYNDVTATIGGPLFSDNLNFFLSGNYSVRADGSPRALGFPTIGEADQARVLGNPQVIEVYNAEADETRYVPLPPTVTTDEDVRANLDIAEGDSIVSFSPLEATSLFLADQITREAAKDDPSQGLTFNGNLHFTPVASVRLRVGGAYDRTRRETFTFSRSLYDPNAFEHIDRDSWRGFASWTQYLSDNVFYQIQGEYSNFWGVNYRNGFSDDISDVLFHGDIDHEANAVAARYLEFEDSDSTYIQQYGDGDLPSGAVANIFAHPGVPSAGGYFQFDYTRFGIGASATAQLGVHQLEFGGEYEQQTRRYYSITGTESLARYFRDADAEGAEDFAVDSYDELAFEVLEDDIFYYGYNFLGTEEVDDQDIEAFYADPESDAFSGNMAPYQPIYYAGFVSDKIEYNDLVLNLGVRVDVFDNNSLVLKDPYALVPIVRAGEVGDLPPGIESDYAVYFDAQENIVGYRDLDGNFYTAGGQRGDVREINTSGDVRVQEDANGDPLNRLTDDVFTDYEPQVMFQPRIGVSFPVTNRALFFARYDVKSQRPTQNRYDTIQQYAQVIESSKLMDNPALEPQRSTNYALGFRQRVGERSAVTISGFYRQIDNLITRRIVPTVYPNNYQTYRNVDFGTVQGVELEYDLRRTNNISLNANYTFQIAQGTGSDPQTTATIVWRQEVDPFYPRFIAPLDFDRRHKLVVTLDYRFGEAEGPELLGARPLANFGINLVGKVAGGLPYTRWESPTPIYQAGSSTPVGRINQQRLPTTTLLNLRLDRSFDLGGVNLLAFLWVQNLLNTDNIEHVYNATGLASNDGYLASDLGQSFLSLLETSQGERSRTNFVDHYRIRANYPYNYSIPRMTRLGLRLTF